MLKHLEDILGPYLNKVLESSTAYATGLLLMLQDINWAVVGGLVLFIARASVDVPKAIDYWKDRKNGTGN